MLLRSLVQLYQVHVRIRIANCVEYGMFYSSTKTVLYTVQFENKKGEILKTEVEVLHAT